MALISFRFWQNCKVPYNAITGPSFPPAGTGKQFDHGAVSVRLTGGGVNWFSTQLPIYVPAIVNARNFNGQLNLPGTTIIGSTIDVTPRFLVDDEGNTVMNSNCTDEVGQSIINGLNNWITMNSIMVGGHNRALHSWEANNCFSMIYWAGMFSGSISSHGNGTDNLCPSWMMNDTILQANVTRVGSRIPSNPLLVSVPVVGSLDGINMEAIMPNSRNPIMIPFKYKRCNVAALIRKIR